MHVQYVGPHDAVELEVNGVPIVIRRNESVDFPHEVAKSLLEQSSWMPKSISTVKAKVSE